MERTPINQNESLSERTRRIQEFRYKLDTFHSRMKQRQYSMDQLIIHINKMEDLKKVLKEKGIEVVEFLFWHMLIGSGIGDKAREQTIPLDTADHDFGHLLDEFIVEKQA